MEPLSLFERFYDAARGVWKDLTCRHGHITTKFTSRVFLVDKWERCSGVGECADCGRTVGVSVPAERDQNDLPPETRDSTRAGEDEPL